MEININILGFSRLVLFIYSSSFLDRAFLSIPLKISKLLDKLFRKVSGIL